MTHTVYVYCRTLYWKIKHFWVEPVLKYDLELFEKKVKVDLVISTLKSQVAQSLSNPWILKIFKFLKFYRCQNCMKISKGFDFSGNSLKNAKLVYR